MSQVKLSTLSRRSAPRSLPSAAWLLLIIPLVATLALAVLLDPLKAPVAPGVTAGDALLAPWTVEFRQGERLSGVRAEDPIIGPLMVEFRQGERLSGVRAEDPIIGPLMIEFRHGERLDVVPEH